jgi:outer membrane protein OmpA-like peptidoglycan-associated protein
VRLHPLRLLLPFSLVVGGLAVGVAAVPASAGGSGTSLLSETFMNSTTSTSSEWQMPTGSSGVCLTAGTDPTVTPIPDCNGTSPDTSGSGALQLTDNTGYQVGTVYNSVALPTSNGLDITWDSYQFDGTGADGISFDLAAVDPDDPEPPATVGPAGGSLGYSTSAGSPGVPYGYLGFGADVFGNFESSTYGGSTCGTTSAAPESMAVRGPGDSTSGYCLATASAPSAVAGDNAVLTLSSPYTLDSKSATSRTNLAVKEEVVINSTGSPIVAANSLETVPPGSWMFATEPLDAGASGTTWDYLEGELPSASGYAPSNWLSSSGVPQELAFGWASSTGGSTEFHEINTLQAETLTPAPSLALMNTDSGSHSLPANSPATITLTPSVASGESESQTVVVSDDLPPTWNNIAASGDDWSCTITGQLVSCSYTGSTPIAPSTSLPPISITATTPSTPGPFTNTANVSSLDAAPATAVDSGSITPVPQTIVFTNSPPTSPLVGTTYTVLATGGGSGNPVTYTRDSSSTSGCSVNAATGVVSLSSPAGTCVIDANQSAGNGYSAAPQVQQTVTSVLGTQSITFANTPPTNPLPGSTYTVSATGGASGNPVTFAVDNTSTSGCTVDSSTGVVTLTLPEGTCVIDANQLGDASYAAATQVQQTVDSVPGSQTINFTNTPPASPLIGSTYTVTTTGGASGEPIVLTVDHTSTSGCTVNSSTGLVTLTAPAGTCIIDANQAGNGVYTAATQVQQSDTSRDPLTQIITFTNTPPASPLIGSTYTVTATGGGSGNPVTFSVSASSTSGCTINATSGLVTLTAPAGTCIIDANQAGDAGFDAGTAQQTVTSVVPADDPTAAITSPSSGGTYPLHRKVATTFSCADPNGPGIATCSDGTSGNGRGVLNTSTLGSFSYVVTATSKSGQVTTTRIRFRVVPASASLTIYFPNNSWALTSAAVAKLNSFAAAIANDDFKDLSVSGYASSTGSSANNHKLGIERARATWSYLDSRLVSLKVNGVAPTLRGLGATRFRVTPSSAAGNRRAVLLAN